MADNSIAAGYCYPNFTDAQKGITGSSGSFILSRYSSADYSIHCYISHRDVSGRCLNGTWYWGSQIDYIIDYIWDNSGYGTPTVSLLNCTGTLKENLIKYKYNDKYVIVLGSARYTSVTRTSANPGMKITLPVNVKSYSITDQAIIYTADPRESVNVVIGNKSIEIFITESHTNYTSNYFHVGIPQLVLLRN